MRERYLAFPAISAHDRKRARSDEVDTFSTSRKRIRDLDADLAALDGLSENDSSDEVDSDL